MLWDLSGSRPVGSRDSDKEVNNFEAQYITGCVLFVWLFFLHFRAIEFGGILVDFYHIYQSCCSCFGWYIMIIVVCVFSCDQAALWMVQSVRPSVRPSVCLSVRLSHLFDYVPIIVSSWNFQELLPVTKVTSMQKVKVRGQRSRSQRSQPHLTVSGL